VPDPRPAPPVALFWGEDEFLLRDAANTLLASHGVDATEVSGRTWQGGETSDLATPSLWGERRALLVTDCQSLPEAGARELKAYLQAPSTDAICVLTLVSAAASRPPALTKLVQSAGGQVRHVAIKRQDMPRWVLERATAKGVDLDPAAATALVGTIGVDAAALDQAVEQLATAFPRQRVGPPEVRAQFVGLGEQRVWDLCDQALTGRVGEALVTLRGLLEAREDPLLVLGGIGSRVRDLLRIRRLPPRMGSTEAARAAGLRYDWQVRRYREQASRFDDEGLEDLHSRVVEADRQIKGGVPGDVVLPALVMAMAGEREAGLRVPIRVSR
jgi:DNA polymerase III subunit delta